VFHVLKHVLDNILKATSKNTTKECFAFVSASELFHRVELRLYCFIYKKKYFVDINDCQQNACNGHGICIDGVGNFSCECFDRYEGENCTSGETFGPSLII
jgi:hypothetical protein